MVHVDLCTNRSGSDNWTHQSCPHNPFLQHTAHVTQGEGQMVKRRGHDVTQKTHEMINKDKWGKKCKGHKKKREAKHFRSSPLSQRQLMLMQRPLLQVNWVSGKQVGYADDTNIIINNQ